MAPFLPVLAIVAALSAPAPIAKKPVIDREVELRFIDDSVMKATLLNEKLELVTKYGTLQVPTLDVKRVEFANRLSAVDVAKIATALGDLGSIEFKTRDRATADLRGLRVRAYPALVKAAESPNPEVRQRVEELLNYTRKVTRPAELEPRPTDTVHTADSKIAGKLAVETLRVRTFQFGEQAVKLADIRTLTHGDDDGGLVIPAPATLEGYANKFGQEVSFEITFGVHNNNGGGLWGTDVYSLGSNLTWAAMHAGLLQAQHGQKVVVRVRIVQSPQQFVGTQRNGAASQAHGHYPPGAFEFVVK